MIGLGPPDGARETVMAECVRRVAAGAGCASLFICLHARQAHEGLSRKEPERRLWVCLSKKNTMK
jgi:hypothetical protein